MTEGFHYIEEQRAAIFEALECEPSEDLIRGLESIINRVLQDKETLKELKEIPTQGEVGKKIEKLKKALEAIIEVSPFIIDQLKSAYDSVWTPTEQEAMQFMDLEEMAAMF
jgi:flagellar motility protein MotE (MotC chaperone)